MGIHKKLWHWSKLHGPRGAALLGFAFVSVGFGLSYVGPWALPTVQAMDIISAILPLSVWGIIWIVNGAFLVAAAFRADQSRSLGLTTGLFTIWTINYAIAAAQQFTATGQTRYWLSVVLFAGMVVALQGLARMVNPAPLHFELVEAPGPAPKPETEEGQEDRA
jgi:hypothetical protein